ncbi:MGMT family protein [Methanoplanus limicola]|uniref:Methylated-DNA/protein-cysteinemethyltransferase n=1 Tax=Methanoplanus limicola DSM 2279 TaxID=937775 RepID=H1Z404_9EURY|nr:MGMT family protein [Methanoplanus limicola]EHQ35683.1 methylated-DNA/protein-cysteinemethyltransferase [Methanoplanus limicola DSM 2279]
MKINSGRYPFNYWYVNVWWSDERIIRVSFSRKQDVTGGEIPPEIMLYLNGKNRNLSMFKSAATEEGHPYCGIYSIVKEIPYGETMAYGEVAEKAGTNARVVGTAMKRNPTPLIVPCHRVVAKSGIGGFNPSVEIKEALLRMEGVKILNHNIISTTEKHPDGHK